MRVASISFSRAVMMHHGGIERNFLIEMIKALPSDSKIVGFGEDASYGTMHLLATSQQFKEILVGCRPSDILAFFNRDRDGKVTFEKLDMTQALDHTQACVHEWKEYVGAMDRFHYCVKCNAKENE